MRHLIAVVVGALTAVAVYQSNVVRSGGQYPGWQIDVAFAAAINIGVVYLIAVVWSSLRKSKKVGSSPSSSGKGRTTTSPTTSNAQPKQQPTSPNPAASGGIQQGLPVSSAFSDAAKFVERNSQRLSGAHQQAVWRASNEFKNRITTTSTPMVWAFAELRKNPLLVAHKNQLLEFGPNSMSELWSKERSRWIYFAKDRFGSISFQINGVLIQNIEPSSNAERIVSILDIPRDDTILGENHELEMLVPLGLEARRHTFEEAMKSNGYLFEWRGNKLVILTLHHDLVEQLIEDILAPPQPDKNSDETTKDMSPIEYRIRQLQKLHDDGLITEDELAERRKEILREI